VALSPLFFDYFSPPPAIFQRLRKLSTTDGAFEGEYFESAAKELAWWRVCWC
jgi:hypothetical protein